MMWEFKFYSRGGQGAVTAAKILVNAAILRASLRRRFHLMARSVKGPRVHLRTYLRHTH